MKTIKLNTSAGTAKFRLYEILRQDRTEIYLQDHPRARAMIIPRNWPRMAMMATNMRRTRQGWPGYGNTMMEPWPALKPAELHWSQRLDRPFRRLGRWLSGKLSR